MFFHIHLELTSQCGTFFCVFNGVDIQIKIAILLLGNSMAASTGESMPKSVCGEPKFVTRWSWFPDVLVSFLDWRMDVWVFFLG